MAAVLGCFIEDVLNAGNNRPFIHSQKVLSYLQQVNNWGEMELRLISIFTFALDTEQMDLLLKSILKKSQAVPKVFRKPMPFIMICWRTFF